MNKTEHTYQTPAGAVEDKAEVPGALYYGRFWRGVWHEVAAIREDAEDGWLLVSGPTFYGWVRPEDIVRDIDE